MVAPLGLGNHTSQKGAGVRVGGVAQLVEGLFSVQETLGHISGMVTHPDNSPGEVEAGR